MKTKISPIKVPFDKNGNQLSYDSYSCDRHLDNYMFTDTLLITSVRRGRSSVHFILKDIRGEREYSMFLTDMLDLICSTGICKGIVSGTWTFCKRGKNFGLKMVKDE